MPLDDCRQHRLLLVLAHQAVAVGTRAEQAGPRAERVGPMVEPVELRGEPVAQKAVAAA